MDVKKTMDKMEKIKAEHDLLPSEKVEKMLGYYDKVRRSNSIKLGRLEKDRELYDTLGVIVVFNEISRRNAIYKGFKRAYSKNFSESIPFYKK